MKDIEWRVQFKTADGLKATAWIALGDLPPPILVRPVFNRSCRIFSEHNLDPVTTRSYELTGYRPFDYTANYQERL